MLDQESRESGLWVVENINELQRGKNGVISQPSIHNEVDLILSVLRFPWEIYFVQSVLASPEGVMNLLV